MYLYKTPNKHICICMLGFVFWFHEEAARLPPCILAFDAVAVQHIRRAVYHHQDFFRSGKTYSSKSLVPALYGFTNKSRMPFMDLL